MDFAEPNKTKRKFISRKSEISRLKKLYREAPENIKKLVQPLIENAAFMAEQLDLLQDKISSTPDGWVETYRNGANQTGKKLSAAGQAYNSLVKNYTNVIGKLVSFLPDSVAEKEDDFIAHVRKNYRK